MGLHGRIHPSIALFNARRDYNINRIEADIISKHMFPLTFTPPKYRESVIVCVIDKFCSIYEVFSKKAYIEIAIKLANTPNIDNISLIGIIYDFSEFIRF